MAGLVSVSAELAPALLGTRFHAMHEPVIELPAALHEIYLHSVMVGQQKTYDHPLTTYDTYQRHPCTPTSTKLDFCPLN
jgi:hypothetical protein